MAETDDPLIKVSTGKDKSDLVLWNADDVSRFIATELEYWKILDRPDPVGNDSIRDFPKNTYARLIALSNVFTQYLSDPVAHVAYLRRSFQKLYQDSGNQLPTSLSSYGQFLGQLRAKLPDVAFNVAVQYVARRGAVDGLNLGIPDHLIAILAVAAYRLGLSSDVSAAQRAAMSAVAQKFDQDSAAEIAKQREVSAAWAKSQEQFRAEFGQALQGAAERFSELWSGQANQMDSALAEFKAVETAYREQLQLAAPTTYWTKKQSRHRNLAIGFGIWCVLYALAATLYVSLTLAGEYDAALKLPAGTSWVPYVLLGARGLFVSIVVFWAGRIFVRMFLSQLHLSMDAHERSTMVMTYLALTQDGRITPEERPLVLQPLFRPTSDGIVKDDGSADPIVSAWLARAIPRV